jgi:hypothetical protein
MWEPRPLTPRWAFTACYRDSFTFCFSLTYKLQYEILWKYDQYIWRWYILEGRRTHTTTPVNFSLRAIYARNAFQLQMRTISRKIPWHNAAQLFCSRTICRPILSGSYEIVTCVSLHPHFSYIIIHPAYTCLRQLHHTVKCWSHDSVSNDDVSLCAYGPFTSLYFVSCRDVLLFCALYGRIWRRKETFPGQHLFWNWFTLISQLSFPGWCLTTSFIGIQKNIIISKLTPIRKNIIKLIFVM